MLRTMRRVVPMLLLVAVVAAAAIALTARPDLEHTRDDATSRWRSVRGPLTSRYEALSVANEAVRTAGGTGRDVVSDVDSGLARWRSAASGSTVAEQVAAANELEGLVRRLASTVKASDRLSASPAVRTEMSDLDKAVIPEVARAFDDAVHEYESARGGPLRRVVVGLIGYDAMPALDLGTRPEP